MYNGFRVLSFSSRRRQRQAECCIYRILTVGRCGKKFVKHLKFAKKKKMIMPANCQRLGPAGTQPLYSCEKYPSLAMSAMDESKLVQEDHNWLM